MRNPRPRAFWLFVMLTIVQGLALAGFGVIAHFDKRGILFLAILVVGLGYRSRLAWGLLVLVEAIPALLIPAAVIVGSGGSVLWGHVAVAMVTGVPILGLLISREIRDYVDGRDTALT